MTKVKNFIDKLIHILTNVNYKIRYDTLKNKYEILEDKIARGLYKDVTNILDNTYQVEKLKKENAHLRKLLKETKREVADIKEELK